jgi:hypothetical protein
MNWTYLILGLAAAVACWRVLVRVRALRAQQREDWDERLVKHLRSQGGDPFSAHEIDFFFDLPDEAACQRLRAPLESEGFTIDFRPMSPDIGNAYTLHARKALRISVPDMQDFSKRFKALALEMGGHYDGWAAPGITRPPR